MIEEERKLIDQEKARRDKLIKYKNLGIDPFGHKFEVINSIEQIKELSIGQTNDTLQVKPIKVQTAGRIKNLRCMGKSSFLNIQDRTGSIQCYIGFNIVGEKNYSIFKLADIGDIVGIKGILMFTHTNELTIRVLEYVHLTKSLKPFPEKYHGLTNVEERYRHRYLDLIVNEKVKKNALMRPKIIREIQKYCDNLGFIEVETSIFSAIPGGAEARPFITHHNTLNKDFYLRIATELPLKKLLVAGLEKVYEIGRIFRNEGMDVFHNPEFTTIELYQAYGDINDMKKLTENLIRNVTKNILGSTIFNFDDKLIDVGKPFQDISMTDAIKKETGIDFLDNNIDFKKACELAKKNNVILDENVFSVGQIINAFFEKFCEGKLIQPTFIHTYPIEVSPLTKTNEKDSRFVDRFELFIDGHEIANAYTELNDPIEQKKRFLEQIKKAKKDIDNKIDYDFLEALEYGMPPAGGVGIGIDRLVMLICGEKSIREVILFPTMKDKIKK